MELPDFRLPASTGQTLSRSSFLGKVSVVMIYLPTLEQGDQELQRLDDAHASFGAELSQLLALTRGTSREVRETSDRLGLTFPILADANSAVARELGFENDSAEPGALIADKSGRLVMRLIPTVLDEGTVDLAVSVVRFLRARDKTAPNG